MRRHRRPDLGSDGLWRGMGDRQKGRRRDLGERRAAADRGAEQAQIAMRQARCLLAIGIAALLGASVRERVRDRGNLRERQQQAEPHQPGEAASGERGRTWRSHRGSRS
jgi:hypothetical protein